MFVEPDSNQYVESIVAAATKLFSEKGYRGTSMRDLGDALGLNAGSLYAHVRSKEDVLLAIVNRMSSVHEEFMTQIARSDLAPIDQLREVARNTMHLIGENRAAATVYFDEWKSLSPRRRKTVIAKRDSFDAALRSIIEACIADGTFRKVDVKLVSIAFASVFNFAYQWFTPSGEFTATHMADAFFDLLIQGLGAGPESDGLSPARIARRARR
jgi:AcrR family transcriptional regulator